MPSRLRREVQPGLRRGHGGVSDGLPGRRPAEGEGKTVEVGDKLIAVFRVGDEYLAIDDVCPHMGASLSGGYVENGIVTCPWHAWRFRLATAPGPTTRGSRSAATRSGSWATRCRFRCPEGGDVTMSRKHRSDD